MNVKISLAVACLLVAFSVSDRSLAQSADEQNCGQSPARGALAACSNVIKASTDKIVLARAHFNRGIAHEANGNLGKALQDYTKSIELNPNYSPPHNNRGIIYAQQGKNKLALQEYNRSIEIDPNNIYALNSRGRHYLVQLSDAERAIEDFDRAIKLDRNYSISFANRGFANQKLKRVDAALADFDEALNLGVSPEQKAIIRKEMKKLRRKQ
jgi:tetratricopeptide (TPR) repeat protein